MACRHLIVHLQFTTLKNISNFFFNSTKRWHKKLQSFFEIVGNRKCPISSCDCIVLCVNAPIRILIFWSLIHLSFNDEKNGERERFFPTRIHQFLVRLHLSLKMSFFYVILSFLERFCNWIIKRVLLFTRGPFLAKNAFYPKKHPKFPKRLIFTLEKGTFFFEQLFPVMARPWLESISALFFGPKIFCHTTPILVNGLFVALGEFFWARISVGAFIYAFCMSGFQLPVCDILWKYISLGRPTHTGYPEGITLTKLPCHQIDTS